MGRLHLSSMILPPLGCDNSRSSFSRQRLLGAFWLSALDDPQRFALGRVTATNAVVWRDSEEEESFAEERGPVLLRWALSLVAVEEFNAGAEEGGKTFMPSDGAPFPSSFLAAFLGSKAFCPAGTEALSLAWDLRLKGCNWLASFANFW